MVKAILLGFLVYTAVLLVLLLSSATAAALGPYPAIVLSAFWCTFAFVAAAVALYTFDAPVSSLFQPSARLRRLLLSRSADHTGPV